MRAQKAKPSWRRRAQARPDEILDAALDEFIAKGFDSARIEDIAARAGLSKGAIYLYFTGKEALLRALIEREIAPIVARLAALADTETIDARQALALGLERTAMVIASPRVFAVPRLVLSVSGGFPEIRDHYRRSVVEPGRAAIERLIARGIASGQFRAVDAKAASRAIIGPILFEALWTHALAGDSALGAPAEFVRAQMDLLLNGLAGAAR
jgi:AcrR family transcriptional regulator